MMNVPNMEGMQKMSQQNMETTMQLFGEWNKTWQAIAAEMGDYSKRSFQDGTSTMEKLMAAKSVEQAMEIQTTYAKRAYDDYMQQMTKLGGMYANMAKDAYKPMEKAMQSVR
ncbi:MAG: phasin family protein [Pseudomonadota bacterium]